ncbi:Flp pilus assembly protein CpaB [Desulfosporosinus lacus]|uniref:Pilus assembly protein CpaB n=1 Tax=Desulfosporosinus lacus DSM 15449 TaxID=1121420 RepID=A0A1M5Q970_9FIRM|nr:Flp pilus assembly protein CpaB [Desulfosporosinus lacus]SHH10319.1 pilus assembly protein CpaB [Desulfosporosinus lacus DSM 15449]
MFRKRADKPSSENRNTVKVQRTKDDTLKSEPIKKALPKPKLNLNRFKNRTTIGIACIILAFLIVFGLSPLINKAAKAQTVIVRVEKDIEAGQRVTADKIEKVTVGGYNLPGNVAKRAEDVVGKYAIAGLKPGDYILSSKISSDPFFNNPYLYNLPEGKVAISVSLKSLASGLSGKLQNGDIVSLIAIGGNNGKKEAVRLPELEYVEVLAVTTKKGSDSNQQNQGESTEDQDIPATVILSVNPIQALKLAEYEENGKLHATLVSRGNEEKKQMLLAAQESIFSQSPEGKEGTASGE